MPKFLAASVPRSIRTAKLGHLRMDSIIGTWHIANAGGGFQVFDVVMQPEADFMRTKNHLAAPSMAMAQPGQAAAGPFVLKDIKQLDVADSDPNPAQTAAAHFRKEFKTT